ncbi:MAG TPA: TolC family protein [Longimicrobium sp.]|nr:TolC family protein [Longimicrobium sp.]
MPALPLSGQGGPTPPPSGAAPAPAGASAASPGLTLGQALQAALANGAAVQLARQDVRTQQGALTRAGGDFSPRFSTTVGTAWSEDPAAAASAQPGQRTTRYQAGVTRQFRSGITVESGLNVTRLEQDAALANGAAATTPTLPVNTAGLSLRMDVPLWRDLGGGVTRAGERAARAELQGQSLALEQTVAAGAGDVAIAYWQYVAAERRVDVYREAEARAERLSTELRALIAADERPPADLNQALANLSAKRTSRIAAEQQVVEARQSLGRLMGLAATEVATLPAPAADFPAAAPYAHDPAAVAAMAADALAARRDLAAAGRRAQAAGVRLDAARDAGRPRVDLSVSHGYTGLASGGGLGSLVQPLYADRPGMSASVQVQLQPAASAETRGLVQQQEAAAERARIAERELREAIASRVQAASEALDRGVRVLAQARETAVLAATTVENERRKNRVAANTLFEVIQAEDDLTGARLSEVEAHLAHATALVRLRYESGALSGTGAAADLAALLAGTPTASTPR